MRRRLLQNKEKPVLSDPDVPTTNHDPEAEARAHALFPAFMEWGFNNGVNADPSDEDRHCHVDDWMPSWLCFKAGIDASDKFPIVPE